MMHSERYRKKRIHRNRLPGFRSAFSAGGKALPPPGRLSEEFPVPLFLFLSLFLFVFSAGCTPDAEHEPPAPRVSVQIRPASVLIGDSVEVRVRVLHPENATVRFPSLPPPSENDPLKGFFSWSPPETRRSPRAGWQETTRRLSNLYSFEVGQHRVFEPDTVVVIAAPDESEIPLELPETILHVHSSLEPEGTSTWPRFHPPLAWPTAWPHRLWILVGIALLAAGAGMGMRGARRRARKSPPAPPLPPHEVAMEALRRLWESGALNETTAEPFYRELSAIVRRYLENRFGLHAPEQTTEEFFGEAANANSLTGEQRERVQAFLAECDLVKFARHEPGTDARQSAWLAAERLVRETMVDAADSASLKTPGRNTGEPPGKGAA